MSEAARAKKCDRPTVAAVGCVCVTATLGLVSYSMSNSVADAGMKTLVRVLPASVSGAIAIGLAVFALYNRCCLPHPAPPAGMA